MPVDRRTRRRVMALQRSQQENAAQYARVVAQTWEDEAFKQRLLRNPEAVLQESACQCLQARQCGGDGGHCRNPALGLGGQAGGGRTVQERSPSSRASSGSRRRSTRSSWPRPRGMKHSSNGCSGTRRRSSRSTVCGYRTTRSCGLWRTLQTPCTLSCRLSPGRGSCPTSSSIRSREGVCVWIRTRFAFPGTGYRGHLVSMVPAAQGRPLG